MSGRDAGRRARHPWRENLETLSVAIVMALALKVFVVEAYKIPTGSMQPTLMGSDEVRTYDRILVDKLAFLFRDPARWEVVVFRYPLDLSVNYIKRIAGVGPEWFRIERGDLWRRATERDEWEILRKPRSVQGSLWKRITEPLRAGADAFGTWQRAGGRWRQEGDRIVAEGEGTLRYAHAPVRDHYTDGYPAAIRGRLRARQPATEDVGDLRLSMEVEAGSDCRGLSLRIDAGNETYEVFLPGPAAPSEEAGTLSRNAERRPLGPDVRLRAGDAARVVLAHVDASLEVLLDGRVLERLEWADDPDADLGRGNGISFGTRGGGAAFEEVVLERDVHYTNRHGVTWEKIPEGHYFMLGDNTQDSADSRLWTSVSYELDPPVEGRTSLKGNSRDRRATDANPRFLSRDPSVLIVRDVYGEEYVVPRPSIRSGAPPTPEPLVKREYVLGKALLVFWPFPPFSPVFRWKLIR